jgi:hypothetical protein
MLSLQYPRFFLLDTEKSFAIILLRLNGTQITELIKARVLANNLFSNRYTRRQ